MAYIILEDGETSKPHGVLTRFLTLHHKQRARYPHMVMSGSLGSEARYSILFAHPQHHLTLHHDGTLHGGDGTRGDFLHHFTQQWQTERAAHNDSPPPFPFRGGWFFFLSYEFVSQLEPRLAMDASPLLPCAEAVRIPAAIIHDHERAVTYAFAEKAHASLLAQMEHDWHTASNQSLAPNSHPPLLYDDIIADPAEQHQEGVARCIEYIHAGDVFQVNLSRRWRASLPSDITNSQLFDRLMQSNPAPFAALASWDDAAIISSSPERLCAVRNGIIETRPIAGTRPRGASAMTDIALQQELKHNPKERAEHLMLVDLERNDIARVCRAGSVQVRDFMTIESYAHVHHIVSVITGRLTPQATPQDALRAVFPGGTITGCPKIRCMEILRDIERAPRHAYTGSLGYINHDGSMDCNILIRTMVRHGSHIEFRAGGGIVADSNPQQELHETHAKAQGLIRSLCGDTMARAAMTL